MKNIYSLYIILLSLILTGLLFAGTVKHEGSLGGKTGSPGDNLTNCSICHPTSSHYMSGWIRSNIPDLGYIAGETYTIETVCWLTGRIKYGFELTAEDQYGNKVGQFIVSVNGETKLINENTAITHTALGTNANGYNTKRWTFQWIAPTTDVDSITFYAATIAADFNGITSGDTAFHSSLTVKKSSMSIPNEIKKQTFTISPNPSSGQLSIDHKYNTVHIIVFNLNGIIVFEQNNYTSEEKIDLSFLNKGIYLVQIQNSDKTYTKKFIIK